MDQVTSYKMVVYIELTWQVCNVVVRSNCSDKFSQNKASPDEKGKKIYQNMRFYEKKLFSLNKFPRRTNLAKSFNPF